MDLNLQMDLQRRAYPERGALSSDSALQDACFGFRQDGL
jgi:hypothetical protein